MDSGRGVKTEIDIVDGILQAADFFRMGCEGLLVRIGKVVGGKPLAFLLVDLATDKPAQFRIIVARPATGKGIVRPFAIFILVFPVSLLYVNDTAFRQPVSRNGVPPVNGGHLLVPAFPVNGIVCRVSVITGTRHYGGIYIRPLQFFAHLTSIFNTPVWMLFKR